MSFATLAHFLVNTRYEDIPAPIVDAAKICFLDWLGAVYAGSDGRATGLLQDLVYELDERPVAEMTGLQEYRICLHAALVNGASSRVSELDDIHRRTGLYPAVTVVGAALAVAEKEGKDGKEFLRAVVLGYEAAIRFAENFADSRLLTVQEGVAAGAFGAAAAAGVLLGLDAGAMTLCLANAGMPQGDAPVRPGDGIASLSLDAGSAAASGVVSALLASRGYAGAEQLSWKTTEGCVGSLEDKALASMISDLGKTYRIGEVSHKPYASSRHTHAAIDATLDMVKKLDLSADDIENITVRVCQAAAGVLATGGPETPYAAKFNMPYCVACAVLFRSVDSRQFSSETFDDERIRSLMSRIEVEVDPSLNKRFPSKWPAVVRIATKSGLKLVANVDYPKGDPENPLSTDDIGDKFRQLASSILPPSEIEAVIEKVRNLDLAPSMVGFLH